MADPGRLIQNRRVRAPRIDFHALRRELELPAAFPAEVLREAERAADRSAGLLRGLPDRTGIGFVTIDPPDSLDLDQAVHISRQGSGYRVSYAIADVMSYVPHDSAVDSESWARGQTIYFPDDRVPLHPLVLSEGAVSLLPDQVRAAVLWTIDLDSEGEQTGVSVERAAVRSRAKLDYARVQRAADAGELPEPIALLPEVGKLREAWSQRHGAINLPLPEQEITRDGDGWSLTLRAPYRVEEYNAQISLLTGMAAATIMLDGGVGLLRTLPTAEQKDQRRVRAAVHALGVLWPDGMSVTEVMAHVDPARPRDAAALDVITELLRGAGYTAFDGAAPERPEHAGVGAPYAHVTAPLRRLPDRYATEVCLALHHGGEIPEQVRAAVPKLPEVIMASDRRAGEAERAAIELTEAVLLGDRVGQTFDAAVIDVNGDDRASIALADPPVRARCDGAALTPGEHVRVRLVEADPTQRRVRFEVADV